MISLGYKLKKKRAFAHKEDVSLKILGMRPDVMLRGQKILSRDRVISLELRHSWDAKGASNLN
jgi:hypothetical protein